MKYLIWGIVILLLIVHQDVWFWSDPTLVFGFIPVGLAFHAGISLAASITWLLATKYAWPLDTSVDTVEIRREEQGGAA